MQPLISAMTSLREVLVAAIKSLLRGKSFIQAFLTFWISPPAAVNKAQDAGEEEETSKRAVARRRSIDDFLKEAERLFLGPIDDGDGLREFAEKLRHQFREGLRSNPACMLPSYNYQLPNGREGGRYLALDVGGSTLRVALVELRSRRGAGRGGESTIVRIDSFKIDSDIKRLQGVAFFDWMADRISQTISKSDSVEQGRSPERPLLMGLAWSFPIEQTSEKGGRLCGMGKGFLAADDLLGQDLGDIIKAACEKKGLHVELSSIVNDSSAALLSEAYINSSTRFGLILGTGVNIAVHLPVSTIGRPKYGDRPDAWHERASHVIVNTELGMFGREILPLTRWDEHLKASHPRPDFQPLEHLVSGYYLGEICRHALVEAIGSTGIFGGVVPPSLLTPYSLDTETLSIIEADQSTAFEKGLQTFLSRHPSPVEPAVSDIAVLRQLSSFISRRSASIVAASVYALWKLKMETEAEYLQSLPPPMDDGGSTPPFSEETEMELHTVSKRTLVAFNGSVIEHYPNYQANLKGYIDHLLASESDSSADGVLVGGGGATIDLVAAKESSLLGAAVALACLQQAESDT